MKNKLLNVFGLPRSGTAFVSTMLNLNPRCIAYHELYEKTPQYHQTIARMLRAYSFVADCNTHGWLTKYPMPASKTVVVWRDPKQSFQATQKRIGQPLDAPSWDWCARKLEQFSKNEDVMVVYYENLFSLHTMGTIWDYLFSGTELFPVYKVANLLELNIQMQNMDIIESPIFVEKFKEDNHTYESTP